MESVSALLVFWQKKKNCNHLYKHTDCSLRKESNALFLFLCLRFTSLPAAIKHNRHKHVILWPLHCNKYNQESIPADDGHSYINGQDNRAAQTKAPTLKSHRTTSQWPEPSAQHSFFGLFLWSLLLVFCVRQDWRRESNPQTKANTFSLERQERSNLSGKKKKITSSLTDDLLAFTSLFHSVKNKTFLT